MREPSLTLRTEDRAAVVVAILPAYNLGSVIADIVARTLPWVDQVIVVADGSCDDTAVAAVQAGAVVPAQDAKRGKGRKLIKGIETSRRFAPDIVVFMDADGQHLPEEIPRLLEAMQRSSARMVVGSRMLGVLRTSRINRFGNVVLKVLSFAVTGRWMTDTESGFRALRADALYALDLQAHGYEIESELLLKSLHRGYRIVEVPITIPRAVPGVTVWDGVKVALYKLKLGLKLRWGPKSPER